MGAGMLLMMSWIRPNPIWWALVSLTIGAVLAAELINTSIESVVDKLHPAEDSLIARAKDCAAAAVLVLSLSAIAVFLSLIVSVLNRASS